MHHSADPAANLRSLAETVISARPGRFHQPRKPGRIDARPRSRLRAAGLAGAADPAVAESLRHVQAALPSDPATPAEAHFPGGPGAATLQAPGPARDPSVRKFLMSRART